jgi:hypothetical protein
MIALGAVATLLAAGISLAKPHEDRGSHGKAPHGGGPHAGGGAAVGQGGGHGNVGKACDPLAVGAVQDGIAAACPCAGVDDGQGGTTPWKNHGQYVRCVAHETRGQVRAAGLKRRCVRSAVPCAARSTCGSDDLVTCGVTSSGTCGSGACSNDAETSCATDDDCSLRSCAVTSTDECTARGGSSGTGSCCSASPSGAFLESPAVF